MIKLQTSLLSLGSEQHWQKKSYSPIISLSMGRCDGCVLCFHCFIFHLHLVFIIFLLLFNPYCCPFWPVFTGGLRLYTRYLIVCPGENKQGRDRNGSYLPFPSPAFQYSCYISFITIWTNYLSYHIVNLNEWQTTTACDNWRGCGETIIAPSYSMQVLLQSPHNILEGGKKLPGNSGEVSLKLWWVFESTVSLDYAFVVDYCLTTALPKPSVRPCPIHGNYRVQVLEDVKGIHEPR